MKSGDECSQLKAENVYPLKDETLAHFDRTDSN